MTSADPSAPNVFLGDESNSNVENEVDLSGINSANLTISNASDVGSANNIELAPSGDVSGLPTSSIPIELSDTRSSKARKWSPIETITVERFKATKSAVIPLNKVTILVGPSGCGKSSVLQAIHWAARAASYVLPTNTKEMIPFERLDYVPSSDPLTILYKGELSSGLSSDPVEIVFKHELQSEESQQVTIKIRAARNRGGITVYTDGGAAVNPYKQRFQFITAYIPGLAGLSERESILAQPTLRRQAASGDAGGVLRNILLNLSSRRTNEPDETSGVSRMMELNTLIQKVHPGVEVKATFDDREDYHISATIKNNEDSEQIRPLETAATGVLQVVQIFAYLLLFKPRIMLIDEPDAHLHPDKQERLIEALENAASVYETQIILTTHSPHIVRAASSETRLVWMKEGLVVTNDDDAIRRLLGWGGLDKSVLFFVEDEDDKPLRSILKQWPEISRQIAVCRCFGVENLPRDKFLRGLLVDGEIKGRALIHRDGDFMNIEEKKLWCDKFITDGVFIWVTAGHDIESYFCQKEYICALYKIEPELAEAWRNEAAKKVRQAHGVFLEKRKKVVLAVWPNGGSPDAEKMWADAGGLSPATVKGKSLHKALKEIVHENKLDSKKLDKFLIPDGYVVAPDLKTLLEKAISG